MDVDVNVYGNPTLEKNGYSHGDFEYVVKGSGKTVITVKCRLYNDATNESYTYTKKITYYLKKYSCPISSIKYGKTSFTSKFKKVCAYCKNKKGVLPVSSFSYKFKKGYKFQSAYVADENFDFKKLKSKKVPKNSQALYINYTKDGYHGTLIFYTWEL